MPTISQIIDHLEHLAPPALQEDYDNSGFQLGHPQLECTGALLTLDCLEATVDEAIDRNCNLIVAHHPIIFKGLKRIDTSHWIGRVIERAIKNDVTIYAIHTNLDNALPGLNTHFAQLLGLKIERPLRPMVRKLLKLTVIVPSEDRGTLLDALFAAGAGNIGKYSRCSFTLEGEGTFRPQAGASPAVGRVGQDEQTSEAQVQVIFPDFLKGRVLQAMRQAHPYEEVAYYLEWMENEWQEAGAGVVCQLPEPMSEQDFLGLLCQRIGLSYLRYTQFLDRRVERVALCGGSGSFLLVDAKAAGVQMLVTGDVKHHEYLEADGQIVIADIGHWESERRVVEYLDSEIRKKFTNFATHLTEKTGSPVSLFIP